MPPASSIPQHRSPGSMSTGLYPQLPTLETSPSSLANSGITEEHSLFSQIEDNPYTETLLESASSRQEKFRYRRNIKSFSNGNDRRVQRRPTIRMPHIRHHDANKPPSLSKDDPANNEPRSVTDIPTEQVPVEQASFNWHQQPLQHSPQYLLPHPLMAPDSFG
ncbi:MAG: hypothetical protein Q9214_005359, partial [Letrouitia sp. 1 TL-2023]